MLRNKNCILLNGEVVTFWQKQSFKMASKICSQWFGKILIISTEQQLFLIHFLPLPKLSEKNPKSLLDRFFLTYLKTAY